MLHLTIAALLWNCSADPAEFELRRIDGDSIVSAVAELAGDGTIVTSDKSKVPGGGWYSMSRRGVPRPDFVRDPHIDFANGDRLAGTIIDIDGDAVRLKFGPAKSDRILRIPVSAIRSVWTVRRPEADPAWLTSVRKRDTIFSRGDDQISAALSRVDPEKNQVLYQIDGKDQRLDFNKLAAIAFNSDLIRVRKPKGPFYRLTLADGSRISVLTLAFDGKNWNAQTLFKDSFQIPSADVIAVDVEQAKAMWLGDSMPEKFEPPSIGSAANTVAVNRNAAGGFLHLKNSDGESTFDRGIGLHAECQVTYSLAGKYRRFEATAGLDARNGMLGDAVLSVIVDGKEIDLPNKGRLTLAKGPIDIQCDVTNAKELKIAVKRGDGGIVQDCVNLVEARLVP